MEKLSLKKITSKGGRKKRHMNREMRHVRHHMLKQRISNRSQINNTPIIMVNPQHTSQTCRVCCHISKESRVTRDIFKCISCGHIEHADVNAACNIGRAGLHTAGVVYNSPNGGTTCFVRRELDVRRNMFTSVPRQRENKRPVHVQNVHAKERQRYQS